ncbi:hypothetical protein EDC03_0783 [Pseudokineococcus lusitanus]|uniref:Uncharacterized protein n=1 Tax=Pseudokineococcus lusitanus TaxID=763993 RepID=A0A3N1HQ77_9ACTN|nr:hypothetical protein EDC03_0783 [Pseudokineococcus lusitanus]
MSAEHVVALVLAAGLAGVLLHGLLEPLRRRDGDRR